MLLATAAETDRQDQPTVLKHLLRAGASVHHADDAGNTCLHLAILAARPEQPWVAQSLITFIEAGANAHRRNHAGFTPLDLASDTGLQFGSFRRDLLLQALLECGRNVEDERLLEPIELTPSYTNRHRAIISGDFHSSRALQLRKELIARLNHGITCQNVVHDFQLHEAAIDRVLSLHAYKDFIHADGIFYEVLGYLQRMRGGKDQIIQMVRERIPYQTWNKFETNLNWLRMTEQAQIAALLEFDWFRQVDPEDLFSSHVDNFIEQLEDMGPDVTDSVNIRDLIDILEHAVPSYRSTTAKQKSYESGSVSSNRAPNYNRGEVIKIDHAIAACATSLQTAILNAADVSRKESIAKTPVEYYGPELRAGDLCRQLNAGAHSNRKDVQNSNAEGEKRRTWRLSAKPRRG